MKLLVLSGALLFAPAVAEEVPETEEKTYTVEEVKQIIEEKVGEVKKWAEETTILGYSLAGLIAAAPSVILTIYSVAKRKKDSKEIKQAKEYFFKEWDSLKQEAVNKVDAFKSDLNLYKEDVEKAVIEFSEKSKESLEEMRENIKVLQQAVVNLEKYSELNAIVNSTALAVKELANIPSYVKAGVTEKVNKLLSEVK